MYCPFRTIKSKIPRKDYGKTNIPMRYYKEFIFFFAKFPNESRYTQCRVKKALKPKPHLLQEKML
jgi:hypothetical protein